MNLQKFYKFTLAFIIILVLSEYSKSDVINGESRSLYRLPKNISPNYYELWLYPHLKLNNFDYEGHVIMKFSVRQRTTSIVLNANELLIIEGKSQLFTDGNNSIAIIHQELDEKKQFYKILLSEFIEKGNYSLHLDFIGHVGDGLFGFYRSAIKVDDKIRWMGVTQFSPTFARNAFPCFDEPYLKAYFKLHIGHYEDEVVTSNSYVESVQSTDTEDYLITTMKETPKMSTYLFGWSVHPNFKYDFISNSPSFGLWTRDSMYGEGRLALEKCKQIFEALQTWIEVPNPIEKIEHIAVQDFHFSAMENWGMITFRESVFLHGVNATPTGTIHSGLSTMAHEYAHTWFGNLVTPEFWTISWLKEGFATYFSYLSKSLVDPELKIMNLFVIENLQNALLDDSGRHLRTMNGNDVYVNKTSLSTLDFVTYKKASSIIRMIEQLMGHEYFQMAMKTYLEDRSYDYTTPPILYKHLRNYTQGLKLPMDLEKFIESYANQPGYPLITITRNYTSNSMEISQQRFYQNLDYSYENDSKWWIPLNLISQTGPVSNASVFGSIWLIENGERMIIDTDIDNNEWIICDAGKIGYYRVNYDAQNWKLLIEHLLSEGSRVIGSVACATLIDDAFNLARGGYINYSIPFHLSNYIVNEIEYEPWVSAIKSLNYLKDIFKDSFTLSRLIQNYIKRILESIYLSLTMTRTAGNSVREKLLRNLIQSTACDVGNIQCLNMSEFIFKGWIKNPLERIDPDMKSFVYCIGIRYGSADDWEKVFERLLKTELHAEKELLINGLGCTKNSTLINRFLDFMMHYGPELPKQYRSKIINSVLNGDRGNGRIAIQYLSQNLQTIINSRGYSFLNTVITAIANSITSPENLQTFLWVVENNESILKPSEDTVEKAIADSRAAFSWIKKYSPIIEKIMQSILPQA